MPNCLHCHAEFEPGRRLCPRCGTDVDGAGAAVDQHIGMVLPGGYVIEELLGGGGMATVYRAEQTALRRTVAVKIVHAHLMHDETIARRFMNEARAASRLNHPHSLSVIDFGRTQEGLLYMVMEHLRGHDLARVMQDEGPLGFVRIVEILRQLLDALSEAHQLGVIHRDLKPENIVVESLRSGSDFVKVVDFGLAKLLSAGEQHAITGTGMVCGTPDFMSPEQCRGDALDARSDLYAVGVILFALLTERLPFMASTPTQVLLMHLTEAAPDPRNVAPDRGIPSALAAVALKALAKKPKDRYQNASEFASALEKAREEFAPTLLRERSPPPGYTVRCEPCGGFIPLGSKFCVECGAPMTSGRPERLSSERSWRVQDADTHPLLEAPPMLERDEDLLFLLDLLQQNGSARSARVVGDPGLGKTTLLRAFADRAETRGHLVVWVEPDRWGAGVAYHGVRSALGQMAGL
ncbi:MAG: serine/threonine-protein kinase, partial [Polyangiaceae bacterium]|nr:serine/threonine-protein kinase [Polyangiaceae bacterium]